MPQASDPWAPAAEVGATEPKLMLERHNCPCGVQALFDLLPEGMQKGRRRMISTSPAIVLVEPQLGENIGAAARAMLNFGLTRLVLVNPRDGWPNPAAVAMASGAGRVLDDAVVHRDVRSALAEFSHVLATTARPRDLSKPVVGPKEAMGDAWTRVARGQRVAVMFGPERSGLGNFDLAAANAIVEVPTVPEFKSLNVAQCVLLVAYEWCRAQENSDPRSAVPDRRGPEPADLHDKSVLYDLYAEDLESVGYFWPEGKAASMRMSLRNLFLRQEFSKAEVKTLHGIRNALRRCGTPGSDKEPTTPGGAGQR